MNDRLEVLEGAVVIRDGRVVSVGPEPDGRHEQVIDARGGYVLPGFIQTHIHLCQTLFRGSADDLPLLVWL
jgi:5-methylthioadenosine/S-adenosylhomocysteine deaminase